MGGSNVTYHSMDLIAKVSLGLTSLSRSPHDHYGSKAWVSLETRRNLLNQLIHSSDESLVLLFAEPALERSLPSG